MNSFKIFIVEDDPWYGELLKYHLSMNPDYEIRLFSDATSFLNHLYLKPDVVSIDFNLPDMNGDALIRRIKSLDSGLPVIIISGQEDIGIALDLLKKGAYDYIMKDDNTKELLWNSIIKIRENANLKQEVQVLREQIEQKFDFEKMIVGQSDAIKKTFNLIEKAVKTNINVSITGETGTGKEVVAKAIHFSSDRKKKPFIPVNMAAIPKELIESELFGHEKGAFTGALTRKTGKFEEANGGTIFLDEIGEMDINLQSKLLRVLQEREVVRVGGNEPVKFDARLISATNKNLQEEVAKGNFREDLYYRIIGLPIHLPPLRERGNDVLLLAKHFIDLFTKENKMKPMMLTPKAIQKLIKSPFPGNVRELKAIIDLACAMSDGHQIDAEDIIITPLKKDDFLASTEKTLKEYNIDIITYFLNKYHHNVIEVSERLDIGKSTIYNMIKSGEIKQNHQVRNLKQRN